MTIENGIESEDDQGDAPSDIPSPILPRPIQEHLGQKLRAAYYEAGDKPAFLGDPALPPELDPHVRELKQRDLIHNKGVQAVEQALGDILETQGSPNHRVAEEP
jgi:hypothetical protein